jgi:hypothetical protein
MPGKPVTLRESEYQVLNQAKTGYEQSTGKEVDWGEFLLFLLGLWILNELTKKSKPKINSSGSP